MEYIIWFFWIFIIYSCLVLILYFIQTYFFYHPEKLPKDFSFIYSESFEEITIPTTNTHSINGLLFKSKQSKGIVIYFKGNTKSIKGWSKFRGDFLDAGYDFFIFDYPGFGKSTGKPTEERIYAGTDVVYSKIKALYPEDKIIIYGRSLGSGFAARIASLNSPHLLILDSPFYSFTELVNYYSWLLPLKYILKLRIPLHKYLKKVKCKTIIFHGNKDRIVPYKSSTRLYNENKEKVILITINKGKHNNLPLFTEYHQELKKILN